MKTIEVVQAILGKYEENLQTNHEKINKLREEFNENVLSESFR